MLIHYDVLHRDDTQLDIGLGCVVLCCARRLIHYDVEAWEGKAYAYGLQSLREMGCPVEGLRFDRSLVIRGLIMDTELGNLVKADRFG